MGALVACLVPAIACAQTQVVPAGGITNATIPAAAPAVPPAMAATTAVPAPPPAASPAAGAAAAAGPAAMTPAASQPPASVRMGAQTVGSAPAAAQAGVPNIAVPGTSAPMPNTSPAAVTPNTAPQDTNPFSNVKPTGDEQALKQQLPIIEQRLRNVEDRVSTIQKVEAALPADALGNGTGPRAGGAPGMPSDAQIELQAATFVACVNGKAMFRDAEQKPFFVEAKEALENDAVRRLGGCKR